MDKQSDKQNKTMKILLYLFLGIFLIMVGLLVFYLVNKDWVSNPNEEKPISSVDTNIDSSYFEDALTNRVNVSYLENGFNHVEELSNQEKLYILFYSNIDYLSNIDEITSEIVDDYFKNNYNTTVKHENIMCSMDLNETDNCYLYDEDKHIYVENFPSESVKETILGMYHNRSLYSKITEYKQENDTYILTKYELYTNPCYSNCHNSTAYFSNVRDANLNENPLITTEENYTDEEIFAYNKNKLYGLILENNFEIYRESMFRNTYTFKKVDDHYILASYHITKLS